MPRKHWFVPTVAMLASLTASPLSASAPVATDSVRIVLVNLSSPDSTPPQPRVLVLRALPGDLGMLTHSASIGPGARQHVLSRADGAQVTGAERWLGSQGDSVVVYVLHDKGTSASIRFDEQRRSSRIQADLFTLAKLVATAAAEGVDTLTVRVTRQRYTLRQARSNLTITASASRSASSLDKAENQAAVTLVTGPREHLFLSTNAGSVSGTSLSYDADTRALEPRDTPTGFFVGINYALGDVMGAPSGFVDGLFVGGTVQGSRRPFDQVGVHLGFRHNPLPVLDRLVSFETVSPYVGLAWTRSDRVDEEGSRREHRQYGRRELVWGVSLNLDKALGWLGGGK